jgi:hypothetical protein
MFVNMIQRDSARAGRAFFASQFRMALSLAVVLALCSYLVRGLCFAALEAGSGHQRTSLSGTLLPWRPLLTAFAAASEIAWPIAASH